MVHSWNSLDCGKKHVSGSDERLGIAFTAENTECHPEMFDLRSFGLVSYISVPSQSRIIAGRKSCSVSAVRQFQTRTLLTEAARAVVAATMTLSGTSFLTGQHDRHLGHSEA